MPTRRVISTTVVALAIIVGVASMARADQAQASLSPDRVLKGTAPIVTITFDKNVPDLKEIKSVHIGEQNAAVQEPRAG